MEQEGLQTLAAQARERGRQAHEAAQRARTRVQELAGRRPAGDVTEGAAAAAERRILAEERLAQLELSLGKSRQRSVNSHESAARVDDAVGKNAEAAHHRAAADQERQLIEDEAQQAAARHRSKAPR